MYLFDPPHIIKAICNNLNDYDFKYESKTATRRDIIALYQMDSKNSICCCPKLTSKHIFPNGFQKMMVKYATQVLSHTVAAALPMAASGGLLNPCATGTAEIILFDQIFEALNSSSFKCRK